MSDGRKQLAHDARDLARRAEVLKRKAEVVDRPLGHHAREAWLHLCDLAEQLDAAQATQEQALRGHGAGEGSDHE